MANHAPFCVLLHVRQWQQPLAGRLRQELLRRAGALLRATLLGGHIPRARRPRRSSMTALLRPSPPHPHAPHLAPMLPMLPPCTLSSSGVIRHAPYLPGVGSIRTAAGAQGDTRAATAPRRLTPNPAARMPHGETTVPLATACAVAIAARRQERGRRSREGRRNAREERRGGIGSGEEK